MKNYDGWEFIDAGKYRLPTSYYWRRIGDYDVCIYPPQYLGSDYYDDYEVQITNNERNTDEIEGGFKTFEDAEAYVNNILETKIEKRITRTTKIVTESNGWMRMTESKYFVCTSDFDGILSGSKFKVVNDSDDEKCFIPDNNLAWKSACNNINMYGDYDEELTIDDLKDDEGFEGLYFPSDIVDDYFEEA